MKRLSELNEEEMLVITPKRYDSTVMDKKEFLQSSYYLDKDEVTVFVAKKKYACFSLEDALEGLEDDMHEEWLSNVMNTIPKAVMERVETEINSYLQKEPTYYPGEAVDWLN